MNYLQYFFLISKWYETAPKDTPNKKKVFGSQVQRLFDFYSSFTSKLNKLKSQGPHYSIF